MKRYLALLLSLSALAALAGCTKKAAEETVPPGGLYVPGTYEGSAQGYGGEVVVSITVDAERITDVTVAGDQETPAVGGAALEDLAGQIWDNGSEIDGVAGATVTSNAAKEAAASALAAAKGGK